MAEAVGSWSASESCGVESSNQVPGDDTLGRFRNPLIKHGLQKKLFAQAVELLQEQRLLLKREPHGFHADFNSILDQEPKKEAGYGCAFSKKDNAWRFGYKVHVGVDKNRRPGSYALKGTSANYRM